MASNIAARRAAKANRRKAMLADRRLFELQAGSLGARVIEAASALLRDCLISAGWEESGMTMLILTRGVSKAHLVVGSFLLDTFCLGIKDVVFRSIEADEFRAYRDAMDRAAPLLPVEPAYARKLLRDLAAWATSIGFPPHRDFATVERMCGECRGMPGEIPLRLRRQSPLHTPVRPKHRGPSVTGWSSSRTGSPLWAPTTCWRNRIFTLEK